MRTMANTVDAFSQDIMELYENDVSVTDIAEQLGFDKEDVQNLINMRTATDDFLKVKNNGRAADMVADYIAGVNIKIICHKYDVTPPTIYRYVQIAGKSIKSAKNTIDAFIHAAELYYTGKTLNEVFNATGIRQYSLHQWLKKNDLMLNTELAEARVNPMEYWTGEKQNVTSRYIPESR